MKAKNIYFLVKAFILMLKYHKGQKDKAGKPYIYHPLTVAKNVKGIRTKTVALLHDIVEDTPMTIQALADVHGFPIEITWAVHSITKKPHEHRDAYLRRVRRDPIASVVKIADLTHNMDLTRIKNPTKRDWNRNKQYQSDLKFIMVNHFKL